jgi:hypothetical protein
MKHFGEKNYKRHFDQQKNQGFFMSIRYHFI